MPICERHVSRRGVESFPPHPPIAGFTNIGEHSIFNNSSHGVGVGLVGGARGHAKEPVLWVDGPQFTYRKIRGLFLVTTDYFWITKMKWVLHSPWLSNFIQAMSSPTHSTFQPGRAGFIMARLVLPQALGKAAAMYRFTPWGLVIPRIWREKKEGNTNISKNITPRF